MITHRYITTCIGKWVVCRTRRGHFFGRLQAHGGDHLVFWIPPNQGLLMSADGADQMMFGPSTSQKEQDITLAWYGVGSVIIPLAAIVGITLIGARAAFW